MSYQTLFQSEFKPAWWLTNPHLQTLGAKYLRRKEQLNTITEILELPDDDFIELAWTELPKTGNTRPIIVLLHGLAGSKDSHYAKGMLKAIKKQGWIGVLMHFRGCGKQQNRQASSYHSGDTRDITFLTNVLNHRYSQSPLALIGFSLGGNVLTRYLAEQTSSPYQAAIAICAPLHLASCSTRINSGFSKIYQQYLVDMLKASTQEKIALKLIPQLCTNKLARIKTIWGFDDYVTAPINGFNNAEHYYQQASGRDVLANITSPCLIIHASDDPFLSHQDIIKVHNLPKNIRFEVSSNGGHVGFIAGNNPLKPQFWLEQRSINFLENHL
ncbi:MAG: hydrolase [Alteromonadaceae bacterium]|nr:hydrolase [Alteromonadaceae bacterium]